MKTRITFLLLIWMSINLTLSAQTNAKISIDFEDMPLPTALKKLEQASGYRILFTYSDVENYQVTTSLHDANITQAVEKVLEDKPLSYQQKGEEYIIIFSEKVKKMNSLKGQVSDKDGLPAIGATILLKKDEKVVTGNITNEKGIYFVPNIPNGNYLLCISFIGYEDIRIPIEINADTTLDNTVLKETSIALDEVVITGSIPTFNMKNGNIVANVSNSVLSKETKVMDVLRKIPGMTLQNGELISYTGGTPLIYVNGKKLQSTDDVKRLEVKNIKHVELITNPGAEYDASVNAVLLITTLNHLEGWSIQMEGMMTRNRRWTNEEAIKLNYQTGGLNLFGTFNYGDYRRKSHQLMKTVISTPDTIWTQNEDLTSDNQSQLYDYSAGADYTINDKNSIGIEYNGYVMNANAKSPSLSNILANDKKHDDIESLSILKDNGNYYHHLNGYYSGKFSEKTKFDIYADYAHTHNGRNQTTNEESDLSGSSKIINHNEADYHVYAVSPKFNYMPNKNHSFTIGGEWSKVTGNNLLEYEGLENNNASSETEEEKLATFLSYRYSMGQFSLNTDLRFENVTSDLHNLYEPQKKIHRSYNNFFPNLAMSYTHGKLAHSLSYRISTIRPNFERLNNASYYTNKYMRQEGNPDLQPEISHLIQYILNYDFINLSLSYRYKKNFIGSYFYTEEQIPNIHIYTWKNFDKQQQLSAVINLRHRFNWYEPSLTGMFQKNIMKVESEGERIAIDRPLWYIMFENNLHLPKNWLVNMEYTYQSKGTSQWFTFREEHNLNVNISKMLLKDKLQIKLSGEHLLNNRMSLYDGHINNIYFWQNEDQDQRKVSLSLVYRFNNYSKKYKGQSAADDVLRRL